MDGDTKSQIWGAESFDPLEIDLSVFDRVYDQYTSEPLAKPVGEKRPDFPEIDLSLLDPAPEDGKAEQAAKQVPSMRFRSSPKPLLSLGREAKGTLKGYAL